MKKIMIFIFVLSFTNNITFADFLDTNKSTLSIKKNYITITSYINTLEVDYLLNIKNIKIESFEDYYLHKDIIKKFISKNITLINNNQSCKIVRFEFYKDEIEYIFTDWFKLSYKFNCKSNISDFKLQLTTFKLFPDQTNSFDIYDLNKSTHKILHKVLNNKDNYIEIKNLETFISKKSIDSDCDWLSDENEKIYKTDPYNPDTDWDFYTDYEEIKNNNEPLIKELWPGQIYRENLIDINCKKEPNYKWNKESYIKNYLEKTINFINKILL